jgi:hypothetical protein
MAGAHRWRQGQRDAPAERTPWPPASHHDGVAYLVSYTAATVNVSMAPVIVQAFVSCTQLLP